MLNLKVDVGLETENITYPITFHKRNVCLHCGAEHSLVFVDIFGNETKKEIHPFDHMKCKSCGRNYSIGWENDPEFAEKMYPTAVELGIKQEFYNLIHHNKIKSIGTKEI